MKTLRIDIIADIVCPWSEIGYRRLRSALMSVNQQLHSDIHWHPYELNPVLSPDGANLYQYIKKQHQLSDAELAKRMAKVRSWADEVKFTIQQDASSDIFNTRKAHQLLLWSTARGNTKQLRQEMCHAYFTHNADLSNDQVLEQIGAIVGIETKTIREIIHDKTWEQAVISTEKQWLDAGINKTPTIIFEQNIVLSGVKSQQEYEDCIRQLLPILQHIH